MLSQRMNHFQMICFPGVSNPSPPKMENKDVWPHPGINLTRSTAMVPLNGQMAASTWENGPMVNSMAKGVWRMLTVPELVKS